MKFGIIEQPYGAFIYSRVLKTYDVIDSTASLLLKYYLEEPDQEIIVNKLLEEYDGDPNTFKNYLDKLISFMQTIGYHKVIQPGVNKYDSYLINSEKNKLKIVRADISLIDDCNLNCKYCYAFESSPSKSFISGDDWINLLDKLYLEGLRVVIISGGEPMLHPDFKNLIEYAARKFIVELNTNGTLINRETAEWLAAQNLQSVLISLDSIISTHHDEMRGYGTKVKAINAINFLRESGVPVRISTTLLNDNVDEITPLQKFADKVGAELFYTNARRTGRAKFLSLENWSQKVLSARKNDLDEELEGMDCICQSILGYWAMNSRGDLKPCNMNDSFFSGIDKKLLINKNSQMVENARSLINDFSNKLSEQSISEIKVIRNTKYDGYYCPYEFVYGNKEEDNL